MRRGLTNKFLFTKFSHEKENRHYFGLLWQWQLAAVLLKSRPATVIQLKKKEYDQM